MDNTDEIKELYSKADRLAQDVVGLKGAIAALLSKSDLTDSEIKDWIARAAKNPVGTASPDEAISTASFYINETRELREINRERS